MQNVQENFSAPHNSLCVELCAVTDVSTATEFTKTAREFGPDVL